MIWLLDTNTIIYAQHVGGAARERLDDASRRGRIVTRVLVIAELLYGVERSSRLHIAATAIDAGATLVTNDGADKGLRDTLRTIVRGGRTKDSSGSEPVHPSQKTLRRAGSSRG